MPSGMLSSKGNGWFSATLLKKNITRFWPIWGLYTAILFFALPMEILLNDRGGVYFGDGMIVTMVPMGAFFGLVAAMALFSYLMNHRACQMMHALPIRREGLFLTNWLSGLLFFLVPNGVILLLSAAAMAVTGTSGGGNLLLWFITASVVPMFFFCFAVLCAMFTGNLLALPVFYGILNVLVIGVCALLDAAGGELLYNYSGVDLATSDPARWCTPAYHIARLVSRGDLGNGVAAATGYCVVLGAAFTLIAVLVYQHRQLERAGDLVTVGWVRPVFQFGFGACIGLSVGLLLYWRFFEQLFGPWGYIAAVAVCGVLGAFAGRMLLKKTLRVFADGWKGCFALGAVMVLMMAGVKMDAFGFQRWTPDPAQVQAVRVEGLRTLPYDGGRYNNKGEFTDSGEIAAVVDLHRTLNDHLPELEESLRSGGSYRMDADGNYETAGAVDYLRFCYTMADGSTVTRTYRLIPITAEALQDPDTYAAKLTTLANLPRVVAESYWWWEWEEIPADLRATGGWISRTSGQEVPETVAVSGVSTETEEALPTLVEDEPARDYYDERAELELDSAQAVRLWEAFQSDVAAGRAKRYLLDDRERQENCYYSDIIISLSWTEIDEEGIRRTRSTDVTFTPQKSQTEVMAVLEELGLKDRLTERAPSDG